MQACVHAQLLSSVQLFVTPWTVARQTSVCGIFQARILEWVTISYSRGSSRLRDRTCISCFSCIARRILYHWTTWEACTHAYVRTYICVYMYTHTCICTHIYRLTCCVSYMWKYKLREESDLCKGSHTKSRGTLLYFCQRDGEMELSVSSLA